MLERCFELLRAIASRWAPIGRGSTTSIIPRATPNLWSANLYTQNSRFYREEPMLVIDGHEAYVNMVACERKVGGRDVLIFDFGHYRELDAMRVDDGVACAGHADSVERAEQIFDEIAKKLWDRDELVPFYCEERGRRQIEFIVGHLQLRGGDEWIVDEHDGRITLWVRNRDFDLAREVAEPNFPAAN